MACTKLILIILHSYYYSMVFFLAFAVKTPTIFLNSWLLKAHVESPLGGSIILAGKTMPALNLAICWELFTSFLVNVITISRKPFVNYNIVCKVWQALFIIFNIIVVFDIKLNSRA